MKKTETRVDADTSELAIILAPRGRDAGIAAKMLNEAGMASRPVASLAGLVDALVPHAGFVLLTEEALRQGDVAPLREWLAGQAEWSDLPFILLTVQGGSIERNPDAARHLDLLGNVTFLERPFHPMTLVSLARAALRARQRQYDARNRLNAIRLGEERFRAAVDAVRGVVWTNSADGRMLGDQPHWGRLTGQSTEDYRDYGWASAVHPDDAQPTIDAWNAAVAARRPFEFEHRLKRADGEWGTYAVRAIPALDLDGSIREWVGIHIDVTDQRATEQELAELAAGLEDRVVAATAQRRAAEEQLLQSQKLETIGQLTGGVAHDFNNLLTPIVGSLDMLRSRLDGDPRAQRLIAAALQSAERAKTLVNRLLSFARRQALEPQAVDVGALLAGMEDLVRRSIGAAITVAITADDNCPPALVDPNQLELAILNLAVNARDAMPEGGRLTLDMGCCDAGHAFDGAPEGSYVRITVVDTGTGMDAATVARAVEPFYTTKGIGKGTGLGLSMVHGLAGQLGGDMAIDSAPGNGTRITIWLPAAKGAAARPQPGGPASFVQPVRTAKVLLVDDEELVRFATADMLRDAGYEVVEASSGPEARQLVDDGLTPDVLVTDQLMPGMKGSELAAELRGVHPALSVLIATGYSDLPGIEFPRIAKPFASAQLVERVRLLVENEAVP